MGKSLNQTGLLMAPMTNEKRAWTNIVTGLILAVAGIVGIVFGRTVNQRFLRISILVLSALSLGTGIYLFVAGTTDLAMGVMNQMALTEENLQAIAKGEAPVPTATQTMTFPGPNFFKLSLMPLTRQPATKSNRRLRYECADGSNGFTVYFTRFGIFNIPDEDVDCKDGSKLVAYDASKDFVIDVK